MSELLANDTHISPEPLAINDLVPNVVGRSLCNDAEPRLRDAFYDDAFVLVNGLFIVKTAGAVVGLPIEAANLRSGQLETDAWYEIYYGDSKQYLGHQGRIVEAFIAGETMLTFAGITRWMHIQKVRPRPTWFDDNNLEQSVLRTAERLRQGVRTIPPGEARRQYRREYSFPGA